MKAHLMLVLVAVFLATSCTTEKSGTEESVALSPSEKLLAKYVPVKLTSDLSHLSENQIKMIPILIEASQIMDDLFWYEAYGDKDALLNNIDDEATKKFAKINYGPWDRIDLTESNRPFIDGVGAKPEGANYYPTGMTKEEFEQANLENGNSLYTFVRRNDEGNLITIPYHVQFKDAVTKASDLLKQAADLAEDEGFKKYLTLRSAALLNDDYQPSDMAWMDMKDNLIDVVIGPIETYEDQLFGYKAAHEAYILLKDKDWSDRLAKYATFLPELQNGLPVPDEYKAETPGRNSQLNAYDVVYYAGDCNAGSKTIAINLPNDEEVQLAKGSRRLQLKNAMRAKFDKILLPISEVLIHEDQRKYITFDAFFGNTMFHEVAHGLGIKNTLDGKGTVRDALKEHSSAIEEGKADILGLYMINELHKKGEIDRDLMEHYVTFMASIFRSIRFGASSAHGKANMIRFNFFKEKGAFEKDSVTNTYKINVDNLADATDELTKIILTMQGDGSYDDAAEIVKTRAQIGEELAADLQRLEDANIPVDIVFEQGLSQLGLKE